ncbi:hypothetical protein ACN47E_004061 [Coniothyrium glycines]
MPAVSRSLESMVLQAHRAKGVRYPTAKQKECFKTWYSYALRQGEIQKTSSAALQEHGRHLQQMREAAPGGRTYLWYAKLQFILKRYVNLRTDTPNSVTFTVIGSSSESCLGFRSL